MANYHILKKTADNRFADVYVHLSIPATQTVAGAALSDATLTYQRAMKESQEKEQGTIASVVPGTDAVIPPATTSELADMQAGKLYEYRYLFRFSKLNLTDAQRRGEIEGGNDNMRGVSQLMTDITTPGSKLCDEILAPLEWWGYSRT